MIPRYARGILAFTVYQENVRPETPALAQLQRLYCLHFLRHEVGIHIAELRIGPGYNDPQLHLVKRDSPELGRETRHGRQSPGVGNVKNTTKKDKSPINRKIRMNWN